MYLEREKVADLDIVIAFVDGIILGNWDKSAVYTYKFKALAATI